MVRPKITHPTEASQPDLPAVTPEIQHVPPAVDDVAIADRKPLGLRQRTGVKFYPVPSPCICGRTVYEDEVGKPFNDEELSSEHVCPQEKPLADGDPATGGAMREVFRHIQISEREICAQIAEEVSYRRRIAGDENGADAARQVAKFIREDGIPEVRKRYQQAQKQILQKRVPAAESWLWKNTAAMESVQQGLKDSAEGKLVDRGSFADDDGSMDWERP